MFHHGGREIRFQVFLPEVKLLRVVVQGQAADPAVREVGAHHLQCDGLGPLDPAVTVQIQARPARRIPQVAKGEWLIQVPLRGALYALVQPIGESVRATLGTHPCTQATAWPAQLASDVVQQPPADEAQQQYRDGRHVGRQEEQQW